MISPQARELLLQSLEHERGGVKVYRAALRCAQRADLRREWETYLRQTENHVSVLTDVCAALDVDPTIQTAGTRIVRELGASLVRAIESAIAVGDREAAQIVASECILLAETRDHLDWELIGELSAGLEGDDARLLRTAFEEVEEEEDAHLYHTQGWCRELWLQSLGLESMLPPPEETMHAKSASEAEDARRSRSKLQ